jgi:hypothetical protein
MPDTVIIPRRFRGPEQSGNGGYSCGVVAALLDGDAEVTLRTPPPLDRPMVVERHADGVRVTADGRIVAEARPALVGVEAPPAPTFAEAERASRRFPWHETHPYPACFVCGPARATGDGLRIHPGAVEGRDLAAAPFVPDATLADDEGRVRPEIVWATLDCPSWFGFYCSHAFDGEILLGRLAGHVAALPRVGERCICVGWSLGRDGRKIHCGSALYSEDGTPLAVGRATWIVLSPPPTAPRASP